MGYAVKTLKDAEEALSINGQRIPGFIIAEYHLPGINGADFAEKLEEGPLSKVPVPARIRRTEAKVVEDIIEHEVGDVLLSPYASAQNLKKIQDQFPSSPKKAVDCVRLWWMTAHNRCAHRKHVPRTRLRG